MHDEVREEVIHALRDGLVPRRGLGLFATGMDPLVAAVDQDLDYVRRAKGKSKWLRGEYGTGKTFATRFLCSHARRAGFATAEVQVSLNDTPLHHLETVYRRLIERLETTASGPGAFQAIVDAWLFELGEEVCRLRGIDEDDPGFADAVETRLEDKLCELSRRNQAFAAVLRAYHRAQHDGDLALAQGLLAWLSGQPHTDRGITKVAKVKGKVDGQAALTFLAGLLTLLRQSGFSGLVVVLDEVETIQLMPTQTRVKSLNALRQLMDMLAEDQLPGLYLLVTGTREFYEGYKGVKSLRPLNQRVQVQFGSDDRFDNLMAVQVRLRPFSPERLLQVGLRVRELYVEGAETRIRDRVDEAFVADLVAKVTDGFGGQVAVAPRVFLRELVDVLDRVKQHPDFDPRQHYDLVIDEDNLEPQELQALKREPPPDGEEPGTGRRKRLDG